MEILQIDSLTDWMTPYLITFVKVLLIIPKVLSYSQVEFGITNRTLYDYAENADLDWDNQEVRIGCLG